ncbi:hypothetical protein BOTNAR_0049g00330 [Botryotinia narcissicola]|uniref:Uncharacterized protein n=1 Tax=Botryotinia narcissicola TaxID=278944 RepID=A0A4Z1J096_9HELO|nr:hypothetical protein BOTNAR_0049g00330 [Botryotinia narcissicola]
MPEKESKTLPKMNISSAWTLLQKVSTLVNNLSKSQEEAKLSRNTDSQAIEKLNNKVKAPRASGQDWSSGDWEDQQQRRNVRSLHALTVDWEILITITTALLPGFWLIEDRCTMIARETFGEHSIWEISGVQDYNHKHLTNLPHHQLCPIPPFDPSTITMPEKGRFASATDEQLKDDKWLRAHFKKLQEAQERLDIAEKIILELQTSTKELFEIVKKIKS